MKKFKKVFAVLLTLAMVMGLCMTTAAADPVGTDADRGTLTVKGIESNDATVTAYPIAMAQYDETNGNFTGYDNSYNITITAPTKEELDGIDISGLKGVTLTSTGDGTYTAEDQPVGMYLIVVTPFEGATTYTRAIASIYYQNEDGKNVITSGDLTMATTVEAPATWVKKSTAVEVDKTAKVGDKDATSAKIGDIIDFDVAITPIPQYSGKYPKLNVVDTLSKGLTYQEEDGVVVKVGDVILTENTDYSVNYAEGILTVDFVVGGSYTLNKYAGKTAVISYKAKLNNDAVLNQGDGNTNEVEPTYAKDSTVNDDEGTDDDKTRTYTFEIDGEATGTLGIINKKGDKTEHSDGLDGAVFTIYTQDPTGKTDEEAKALIYTNDSGTIGKDGTVTTATKTFTKEDGTEITKKGQLHMKGLAAGTYYIRETSAPTPYSVNTHVYKVEITPIWDTTIETPADAKICIGATIKVDDTEVSKITSNNDGETIVEGDGADIMNTSLTELPSTGGIGTTIFTIGGCAIMIIAAALFFASRRKSTK